jgi:hypothetical protein
VAGLPCVRGSLALPLWDCAAQIAQSLDGELGPALMCPGTGLGRAMGRVSHDSGTPALAIPGSIGLK